MALDPETSGQFLEKAKEAAAASVESATATEKPAEVAPSGEPAASEAKAPDLSQYDPEFREIIAGLPAELQQAAESAGKRMQAHLTRRTTALSKDEKYAKVGRQLLEDEDTRKAFFAFQQQRLLGQQDKPAAPKEPKKWLEAATDAEFDRTARETVKEEVTPLEARLRAIEERVLVPQERLAQADSAWRQAVEAEGIVPGSPEYQALTRFVNETIASKQASPAEVVNEANAAIYLALAQQALGSKTHTVNTPATVQARAATIKSSGTGKATTAPKPWDAEKRKPTEAEFFMDFAKSQYGLTERDLGDLRKSGATAIRGPLT